LKFDPEKSLEKIFAKKLIQKKELFKNKMSIENIYELFKNSTGITTDTRKIEKGNIFLH
jgi:hypothetical protein